MISGTINTCVTQILCLIVSEIINTNTIQTALTNLVLPLLFLAKFGSIASNPVPLRVVSGGLASLAPPRLLLAKFDSILDPAETGWQTNPVTAQVSRRQWQKVRGKHGGKHEGGRQTLACDSNEEKHRD